MNDLMRDADVTPDVPADVPQLKDFGLDTEVPTSLEVLPDGRETVVIGDPAGDKRFTHEQGDNWLDFEGTCGLCSCENVLRSFGLDVSENGMVIFATERGLCTVTDDPKLCGGTTAKERAEILTRHGIPASAFDEGTLDDLAANLEQGRGVIIAVNAGVLWNNADADSGSVSNHAVTVTGVARDPMSGEIQGFFVNDSGSGKAGQFIDASMMREAWEEVGGSQVVTLESRPFQQ